MEIHVSQVSTVEGCPLSRVLLYIYYNGMYVNVHVHVTAHVHVIGHINQLRACVLFFQGFREGRFQVLVATDVAARGLDIPEVDLVIQCELPKVIMRGVVRE